MTVVDVSDDQVRAWSAQLATIRATTSATNQTIDRIAVTVDRIEQRMPAERYDVDPLFILVDRHAGRVVPISELAVWLGVNSGVIYRGIREGLSAWQADRWSCRLGFHPSLVWGVAWWAGAA